MLSLIIENKGICISLAILLIMLCISIYVTPKHKSFEFDPEGRTGEFEKLLSVYLDLIKFIIGLASGSIVLLIGTSPLRDDKNFLTSFSDPLYVLSMSILFGILFMTFLITDYESYRHKTSEYLRWRYIRNLSLGYSSLCCFSTGYIWLIWAYTS